MSKNHLFPVFLKVHDLRVLIVGGGSVCLEKLTFLLKSSPQTQITVVSPRVSNEVIDLVEQYEEAEITIRLRTFVPADVNNHQIVLAATSDSMVNETVKKAANEKEVLVNVADDPERCDFFMGSIVNKGNVKIAISTNGQSPTLAKRLRQLFEHLIPDEIDELAENLNTLRKSWNVDFRTKVKKLNLLTEPLIK